MTNFLIDYAKKNVEKLIDGALKELRYIYCFTCIAKEFEEEKDWLQAKKTAIGQRVQVAKRRGEDVQADALFWDGEVDKIIHEDSKTKQKCFFGLCPDCIWRYRRGKELANKKERIKKIVDAGKELGISLPAPLPDVERYSSRHYISFKSRVSKYNELLDALEDEKNYIIGLQGMGGTGKTTLAKEVGKKLKQSKQFTYVIDTAVSFSPNIKKIQDDIAGPLGLTFDDCSESDRPKKLWKRLTNGEKILLILDDVWTDINFQEIGIPDSDNHRGCRILVTTRNVPVCNKLGCSKTIKLELLSQEDAWEMFKQHAGLTEMSGKSLLDKGFKIANECQGLPIAIAVIARSLKGNQRQKEWDVALKSLQKHAPIHKTDDDGDDGLVKIYERLKVSYDNMKDEKSKKLFLLCSVFPEDAEIPTEMLIRLGISAGLFGENYGNYEDARNQVVISKNKLLDSCLLLEVDDDDGVKMHDLVRDTAQWIANKEIQTIELYNKNQKTMVEREKNIKYLVCEGKVKDVLSFKLDSSKLQILIVSMHKDGDFHDQKIEFPNSFFENISGLRAFHFCIDDIFDPATLSLPQSIQSLKNIRYLCFYGVDLGDISILENLQSLETLDLEWCKINELPEGLAKLHNLRLLELNMCEIKSNNPFKVIEGCSSLEELYFFKSFNDCCREISFQMLPRFILSDDEFVFAGSVSKCVSLSDEENKHLLLIRCQLLFSLFELTTSRSLVSLEYLTISECMGLEYIIIDERKEKILRGEIVDDDDDSKKSHESMFPKLKDLHVDLCDGLEFIFECLSIQDLPALEILSISDCRMLRYIFSQYVQLGSLKEMHLVGYLPNLINIFPKCHPTTPSRDASKPEKHLEPMKGSVFLWTDICCLGKNSKLKHSEDQQKDLPSKTTSLLVGPENSFSLNYLALIKIKQCEKLEFVFSTSIFRCLPQLGFLIIEECEELKHIIEDDLENEKSITFESTNTYFPKLEILVVVNCNKLKCVFQTSICKELPKLKVLIIREAYELQEIFKTEGDDQKLEIPNLEVVSFINLPNLCYAQGMHSQAIKYRLVQNCHKLSLTSVSKSDGIVDIDDIISYVQGIDHDCYMELKIQLEPLISHFTCNGKPSSEITQEFAVGVEAKAASESGNILTSSQPQGVKMSAEDGITPTDVKTLTSSTHSKSDSSSSLHLEFVSSSLDPLITSECETSSKSMQKDGDCQIAKTSLPISTTDTNDEVSLNADTSMKVSSNIEEQFPKDDKIIVSPSITSPIASQFPSIPSKGELSQIIEDLSSPLLISRELEQLVSKKHLDYENLSLLTDFLLKHPSVLLKDTSLSNRYKGYAYNCLAELLKFLQTHSVLDVFGSNHSEFVELLQDVRKCGFDKELLDGIERRILFPDLKHQLTSSEAVLEGIIQQKRVLSAPIGY